MNFWTMLRLLGIALGTLSAVMLARDGFGVEFGQAFERFLDTVEVLASGLAQPIEALLLPVLRLVSTVLDINVELLPHWKYSFALTWLVIASMSRAVKANAALWMWGGFCALAGGVMSGIFPLDHAGAAFFPAAAFFLCLMGSSRLRGVAHRPLLVIWFLGTLTAFPSQLPPPGMFEHALALPTQSPALFLLTVMITGWAALSILASLFKPWDGAGETWWRRALNSADGRTGLDILSVLGLAAIITYVGHLMA